MDSFRESTIEFAEFVFEMQKVVCYTLANRAGGKCTILNFPSPSRAEQFKEAFLEDRNFSVIVNGAQIVCLAGYDRIMRPSEDDLRVRFLTYNREFMMGTLEHMM